MPELTCDFGLTAKDYALHRVGFPDWFFERLEAIGLKFPGKKVLDLGTGTGLLARAMAKRGAIVTGIDVSEVMLEAARQTEAATSHSMQYVQAPAEATGQGSGAFDLVTAATCWHWFDRKKAALEAMRVLAPGGAIVICSFDWLPRPGNLVAATEELVKKHNPAWKLHDGDGLKPSYVWNLREAGFERTECFGIDCTIDFSHERWRGRIRASAGVAASLPEKKVAAFDRELAELLRREFPEDPQRIEHCAFAAIGWKPKIAD